MNDVQAEITAVEDALKNGITHAVTISTGGLTVSTGSVNISGPSSLATLNVSGGSTLAGLTVTSTASFASSVTVASMTVSGNLTVGGVISGSTPMVKLSHSATQGVANSAWTGLNWDIEDYNASGMHSTSANSSRITFAASSGVYCVGCSIEWGGNPNNQRFLRLMLNDGVSLGAVSAPAAGSVNMPMSVVAQARAVDTSYYVTVQAFQNSGSTMSIISNSTIYGLTFWAHRVG